MRGKELKVLALSSDMVIYTSYGMAHLIKFTNKDYVYKTNFLKAMPMSLYARSDDKHEGFIG
jgi:hypothetical protein